MDCSWNHTEYSETLMKRIYETRYVDIKGE